MKTFHSLGLFDMHLVMLQMTLNGEEYGNLLVNSKQQI